MAVTSPMVVWVIMQGGIQFSSLELGMCIFFKILNSNICAHKNNYIQKCVCFKGH